MNASAVSQQIDPQTFNDMVQQLLSRDSVKTPEEVELLNDHKGAQNELNQLASQIAALEERVATLKTDRTKLIGVQDYILRRAVINRVARQAQEKQKAKESAEAKTKSEDKPADDNTNQAQEPIINPEPARTTAESGANAPN